MTLKKTVTGYFILFILFLLTASRALNCTQVSKHEKVKYLQFSAAAHDENGHFIFKKPIDIAVIKDGTFFVADNRKVLKFNKNGKFLETISRKGRGPGEATHLNQLFVQHNQLIVNTGIMGKLMVFDLDGGLIREIKSNGISRTTSAGFSIGESSFRIIGGTRTFDLIVIPAHFRGPGESSPDTLKRYPVILLPTANAPGKPPEYLTEIPVRAVRFKTPMGKKQLAVCPIITASSPNHIYFSHTERYEIKKFNITKRKIEAVLKRKYNPVVIPPPKREEFSYGEEVMVWKGGKTFLYRVPPRKDFVDIQGLHIVGDHLWVITSTVDPDRGVLVDAFDGPGNEINHFYLHFPRPIDLETLYDNLVYIKDNSLFVRERDDEDNYMLVKYNIPLSSPVQ